jgi:hypothetical protein
VVEKVEEAKVAGKDSCPLPGKVHKILYSLSIPKKTINVNTRAAKLAKQAIE